MSRLARALDLGWRRFGLKLQAHFFSIRRHVVTCCPFVECRATNALPIIHHPSSSRHMYHVTMRTAADCTRRRVPKMAAVPLRHCAPAARAWNDAADAEGTRPRPLCACFLEFEGGGAMAMQNGQIKEAPSPTSPVLLRGSLGGGGGVANCRVKKTRGMCADEPGLGSLAEVPDTPGSRAFVSP